MKYLLAGNESKARFDLMIQFTSIKSESMIASLSDHLVRGFTVSQAAIINGTKQQNVTKNLLVMEKKIKIHEALKEMEWAHIPNHLSDVK